MTFPEFQWYLPTQEIPPKVWLQGLRQLISSLGLEGHLTHWTGQLLWQRGWRDFTDLKGFLSAVDYKPSSPFALSPDMEGAIARLHKAYTEQEKVVIWGDFDADGLTATAVLWEGLGQYFTPYDQLRYYVPNRFTESHGLSQSGLDSLAAWGCQLIVTCDTGSTAAAELDHAQTLGIEIIITDHHTLPDQRPPVIALINPRQLPREHPLADLSGVAVAYKLVEAMYERLPSVPQQPLETLLDLVAIGLIADLVALKGDCRHLTQVGLKTLEQQAKQGVRPGVTKLLEFCKRTGDRPSDVAFGIGPRINAVSRIHGDASFGVELLTSRDRAHAETLALEAELANTRRKELQGAVKQQAMAQLTNLDLSTTQVIILSDPQWSPGVLRLVASQIAQDHGRPTILLQTETTPQNGNVLMARGSARSVRHIDLYELVKEQSHLLTSFGGHPYAAGMTLPVDNLPLFTTGINRALRTHQGSVDLTQPPGLTVDLVATVEDLGRDLFKALKLLEPYGMGNPVPRLLLRNIRIDGVRDRSLKDRRGRKQRYHQVTFSMTDDLTEVSFPGHWWGHRRDDLPEGNYDVVVELDFNAYKRRYEARLIDIRASLAITSAPEAVTPVQGGSPEDAAALFPSFAAQPISPPDGNGRDTGIPLALPAPKTTWQQWVGIAKYLSRTGESRTLKVLQERLNVSEAMLCTGLRCLAKLGFTVQTNADEICIVGPLELSSPEDYQRTVETFLAAAREDQFRRRYCCEVASA